MVLEMLVCHCKRVNDRTIRGVIRDGAGDLEAIGERCGAGTGCGGCHQTIDRLLEREDGGGRRALPMIALASLVTGG